MLQSFYRHVATALIPSVLLAGVHMTAQAMSDAEVAQLADRVDQAPAGAGVVGILVAVFVVLVVTDLLGWTSVFPFTRSIR